MSMEENSSKVIRIEYVITAPRERVWKAFTTPEDILKWYYATDGWTTPHAHLDVQVGGKFSIGFQSPDRKNDFDFEGTYTEVDPPNKLAYIIADGRPVTVMFTDEGDGKTKITLDLTLESEHPEGLQREGWTMQLVHLNEYLTQLV